MGSTPIDFARSAFDFIEAIEGLETEEKVIDRFSRELLEYGFTAWVITGLPVPGDTMRNKVVLSGWPREWHSIYVGENLAKDDPVSAACFRSVGPFEWKDARYDPAISPEAHDVMTRATEFGMLHGYCVPIHTFEGFQDVVSMSGRHVDLSNNAKRALHLMSYYAREKAISLLRPVDRHCSRILTAREQEVLKWTAAGKTVWEISVILGIARDTVAGHLKKVAVKLNTPTKAAAVATALRRGELSL